MRSKITKKIKYLYIFFPIVLFLLSYIQVVCDDYFFHIRLGEYILEHGINKNEPFSWIGQELGLYWVNHEWISEVIMAILSRIVGDYTPYIFVITCYIITVFIIFQYNKCAITKNQYIYLVWSVLFTAGYFMIAAPRPHLLSGIYLCISIIICESIYKNKKNSLWLLHIPMTILWVNSHGGSSHLAWAIPVIYLLTGLINIKYDKFYCVKLKKTQLVKYITLIISSIIALFINPFGIEGVTYFFTKNKFEYEVINEWRPWALYSFSYIPFYIVTITLLLLFIIAVITKKKLNIKDICLLGAMLLLALKSHRFVYFFVITFSFIYPRYLTKEVRLSKIGKFVITSFTIIMLICVGLVPTADRKKLADYVPKETLSIIDMEKPKRLYNGVDLGENMIYEGYTCFADSRCDLYKDILTESYLFDLNSAGLNIKHNFDPDEFINKYKFDGFIVGPDDGSNEYLKKNARLVYSDKYVNYYKPREE